MTTTDIGGVLKVKNEDEKKINNYVLNYASTFCQHSLNNKKNLIVLQIVQKMKYISNVFYKARISTLSNGTEVRFSSFFSGGFITALPERKLVKRMSLHGRTFIRNSAEKLVRWKF